MTLLFLVGYYVEMLRLFSNPILIAMKVLAIVWPSLSIQNGELLQVLVLMQNGELLQVLVLMFVDEGKSQSSAG
jgi:hypothetical protein